MIDADLQVAPPPRRVSLVVRTLRPLQQEMGILQDRLAFLSARKQFGQRNDHSTDLCDELAQCSEHIARLRGDLEAAVGTLPLKSRADTRLVDARVALDRAEATVAALSTSQAV